MKDRNQQARACLEQLVTHVFSSREGLVTSLTYEELAERIGRLNKYGSGHAHGMGGVLGRMGHLLQGLEGEWGEKIPYIQSLVVLKAGPDRGLPDKGINEFWRDYPRMSRAEKENLVRAEYVDIAAFGSRWNDVLSSLGLRKVIEAPGRLRRKARPRGRGESPAHEALKNYVYDHPGIVGVAEDAEPFAEYTLPSLDKIDVLFKTRDCWTAVEVKAAVSDSFPPDYERGLYQTVKYGALLRAMASSGDYEVPETLETALVLQSSLPTEYRHVADALAVRVIEQVNPQGVVS